MIKYIVHLGDIHIRTYRFHDEYKLIFSKLFTKLTDLLKEYKREEVRIVIAGDLLHQKIVISNEQLILASWFIKKLEEIAPVIIIAGNHDLIESNKDRLDSITPIVKFLDDKNVNYFKESKCYLDDNIVWCVYSIFEENKEPDIISAREEFGPDKKYIGLFHGPLIGAKTDLGFTIDHGVQLEIFKNCDVVLCGDIHQHQKLMYNETKIVMPSSLIQQNFGENVTGHGCVIWDVNTFKFTFLEVENPYPFYQFKITSIDDLENNKEEIINL